MSIEKQIVTASNAPPAIGPYSHAVKANGMLYLSGCIGLDPASKALVPGGMGPQTRMALTNLKNILEAGGSSLPQVVKCTVLLESMSLFPEFNAIYAEYFPENPPARTTFAVAGLPLGAMMELDAIAISN